MAIYLSHGEKGGVGKSRLAMILIDYLIKKNARQVVLVEGDKSGQDVGAKYENLIETGFINLNRPDKMHEAFSNLGNWIEEHAEGKDVVINLPGQASDTLDKFADLLVNVMEMAGHDLTVFYSIGTLDIHVDNLVKSMIEGAMSVVPVNRQIVVMSEFLGKPDKFAWISSVARKKYIAAGGVEVSIPVLEPESLDTLMEHLPGGYSMYLGKDSPLSLTNRGLLFKWLKPAHEAVAKGVQS